MKENPSCFIITRGGVALRYGYPLIQYKQIGGRAAIVCIGKGIEDIREFLTVNDLTLRIGERTAQMEIDHFEANNTNITLCEQMIAYSMQRWMPFSSDNYHRYRQMDGIVERMKMIERILIGNILSLAKGTGVWIEGRLRVKITALSLPLMTKVKGIRANCYNVDFSANINLPDYIGLGKHSSFGFGVLCHRSVDGAKDNDPIS